MPLTMDTWERREIFRFFSSLKNPFWSVTCPVDVTELKAYCTRRGYSFYHALCYFSALACADVPEMMIGIRDGQPVRYPRRHPSFTALRPGERCFRILTVPLEDSLPAFLEACRAKEETQTCFIDMSEERDDLIFISCLPWLGYTALNGEMPEDPLQSVPRMTWGRYSNEGGRLIMPFTLEVNHAFADGLHAGEFYRHLEARLAALKEG